MIQEATFGAGCFWCIEACFKDLRGLLEIEPGYAGGHILNPTYHEVCSGTTGHAEVARIVFEDELLPYSKLLELFWFVHDPTQLNKQGNDIGTQYRSVIFYHNEFQKKLSLDAKELLEHNNVWKKPIVTEISPIFNYFQAEEYHKNYFELNPQNMYCQSIVRPKVDKFKKVFQELMK